MRSAGWMVGFMVMMAVAAGCPEDEGDGASGNGGGSCVDNGTSNGLSPACAECGCTKCTTEVEGCQDALCQAVLSCGISTGCTGSDCYCGIGVTVATCLQGPATGPCMDQIIAASGLTVGGSPGCMTRETCAVDLASKRTDPANPLYHANKVSECTKGAPAVMDANGNITTPAIIGMCMAECQ